MSIEILMRLNDQGHLVPDGEIAREVISKVGKKGVLVSIKKPRNPGHHRKLFALIKIILNNQEHYTAIDEVLAAFKIYTGHCAIVVLGDGTIAHVPKSIAFHAMGQIEFDLFWDQVVKVTCERIIPGMQSEDLEREILEIISDRPVEGYDR